MTLDDMMTPEETAQMKLVAVLAALEFPDPIKGATLPAGMLVAIASAITRQAKLAQEAA